MSKKKNNKNRGTNNTPKSKSNITPIIPIPPISEKEALDLLNGILKGNSKRQLQIKKERLSDYNALVSYASEWLDCFMIIGYDLNGDGVAITKANSIKDQNSLSELIKKIFVNIMTKNG